MARNTNFLYRINGRKVTREVKKILDEALHDVTDDLANMASEAAPIDEGILEGSFDKEYHEDRTGLRSTVFFNVNEGDFNYAKFVHDTHPIGGIGEKTRRKGLAQSGITGKTYPPGGNYLKGPLDVNREAYTEYIDEYLKSELRR